MNLAYSELTGRVYIVERKKKEDVTEAVKAIARKIERAALERLRDFVEDAAHQVGCVIAIDGKKYLTAGGLSTAEEAFSLLGWDDPYLLEEEK